MRWLRTVSPYTRGDITYFKDLGITLNSGLKQLECARSSRTRYFDPGVGENAILTNDSGLMYRSMGKESKTIGTYKVTHVFTNKAEYQAAFDKDFGKHIRQDSDKTVRIPAYIYDELEQRFLQAIVSDRTYYDLLDNTSIKSPKDLPSPSVINMYPYIINALADADYVLAYGNPSIQLRAMVWNYYAEEFGWEEIPIEIVPDSPETLKQEADSHMANAKQHLNNVEHVMNTLNKYEKVASKKVHLIHGRPAEEWDEQGLIDLIRSARQSQEDIKDLTETSKRMKTQHEQLEKDIAIYVKALDALKP